MKSLYLILAVDIPESLIEAVHTGLRITDVLHLRARLFTQGLQGCHTPHGLAPRLLPPAHCLRGGGRLGAAAAAAAAIGRHLLNEKVVNMAYIYIYSFSDSQSFLSMLLLLPPPPQGASFPVCGKSNKHGNLFSAWKGGRAFMQATDRQSFKQDDFLAHLKKTNDWITIFLCVCF